jgi:hypothetical protein
VHLPLRSGVGVEWLEHTLETTALDVAARDETTQHTRGDEAGRFAEGMAGADEQPPVRPRRSPIAGRA